MAHLDDHDRNLGGDYRLYWAYVIDNQDPEKRGRLRIGIPGKIEPISDWVSVVMPGAGPPRRGIFCPYARGSLVLVGFIGGDVEEPVVIGGLPQPDAEEISPHAGLSVEETSDTLTFAMGRYSITMNASRHSPALVIRDEGDGLDLDDEGISHCLIVFDGEQRAISITSTTAVQINSSGAVMINGLRVTLQGRPVLTIRQNI